MGYSDTIVSPIQKVVSEKVIVLNIIRTMGEIPRF